MIKRVIGVLIAISLVFTLIPLAPLGNGEVYAASAKTKAKKAVVKYLKAAKKYDIKTMKKCFAKKDDDLSYPEGQIGKAIKKYNKKMKWKIISVKKKGKKYKVKVKVKHPDLSEELYDALYETLKDQEDLEDPSSDAAMELALEKFESAVKAKESNKGITYETKKYTFTVVKKKKKWLIEKQDMDNVDIAAGNTNLAIYAVIFMLVFGAAE